MAARYKLPPVYAACYFVTAGGLISYGPNYVDQFRRAAGYVDCILRGENPAELPVQAPTKYEMDHQLESRKNARARCACNRARSRRRGDRVKRREFITLLCAAAWPIPAVLGQRP